MTKLLLYTVPLVIAAATLGAVRFAAGGENWVRYSAPAVAVAFLTGWALVLAPGWVAYDSVTRIGHIVGGAALAGVVLDAFWPALIWRRSLIVGFAVGCAWLSVNGSFVAADVGASDLGRVVVLAAVWALVSLRLIAVQGHPPTGLVMLVIAIAGVAAAAAASGFNADLLSTAALLGVALVALAVASMLGGTSVSPGAALVVAAAVMGMAWAIAERTPGAWIGLAVMLLVPFADRTAQRVPMPEGGISGILYVLVLIAMASIPVILSAFLILVTASQAP